MDGLVSQLRDVGILPLAAPDDIRPEYAGRLVFFPAVPGPRPDGCFCRGAVCELAEGVRNEDGGLLAALLSRFCAECGRLRPKNSESMLFGCWHHRLLRLQPLLARLKSASGATQYRLHRARSLMEQRDRLAPELEGAELSLALLSEEPGKPRLLTRRKNGAG